MARQEMELALISLAQDSPNNSFDLSGYDIWLNNSNNLEGKDLEASALGFENGICGIFVGCDDDFFPLSELEETELEMVFDEIF